ncbi:MAG: hypothetical protein WCH44_15730 [Betaproteobacteria bacterium]
MFPLSSTARTHLALGYRIATGILAIAVTVFVGYVLGLFLASLVQDPSVNRLFGAKVEWGLLGIGLTYLLTSLQSVIKYFRTMWEYLTKPAKQVTLFPDCLAVGAIIAYFVTLASVFLPTTSEDKSPREFVYLTRTLLPNSSPIDRFSVLMPLAEGSPPWRVGVDLTPLQLADLFRLVHALRSCSGSTPEKRVEIRVRGYADSNEFSGKKRSDMSTAEIKASDELNLRLANRRGEVASERVKWYVVGHQDDLEFVLQPFAPWGSYAEMELHRPYKTASIAETGHQKDQGLFNRRVDIEILRLGECERLVRQGQ